MSATVIQWPDLPEPIRALMIAMSYPTINYDTVARRCDPLMKWLAERDVAAEARLAEAVAVERRECLKIVTSSRTRLIAAKRLKEKLK